MFLAVGELAVGSDNHGGLKGRPPPRPVPDDFDVIFVEQGRDQCEGWYRASKRTVNRWLGERGKQRLIDARARYVAHQRANGKWLTRSSRLVEHHEVRPAKRQQPVRDRRKVSFIVARHAAQHLRIIRNGGFIVSPAGKNEWFVGTRRLSAGQMLDLAVSKGFDAKAAITRDREEQQVDRLVEHPERLGDGNFRPTYVGQRPDGTTYMPNRRKQGMIRRALQSDDDEGVN